MQRLLHVHGKLAVLLSIVFLALDGGAMAATPDYPLKRGSNPRYLLDQNDRPFLIHGDSPWSLMVQPTKEEAEQYLRDRHLKGFNSIIVCLIENIYCDNPPYNRYGEPPFTTDDDYSTPNPAYFAHVDWVLTKAAEYGIQVFLFPSYLGFNGGFDPGYPPQGWYQEMVANGAETLRQYGRFLGQRYKDFNNIIWVHGGDYNPPDKDLVRAIAEGILEFDTNHLHTVHTGPDWSAIDIYPAESWLDINNTYSYAQPLVMSRADYARTPVTPFFLIESIYEGDSFNASNQDIRRQAYWSNFSGSCGQFMGNFPLYEFSTGWQQAMDGVASHDMANLRRLMDSRPWWTFVPDVENAIVVAGAGDPDSSDPSQYYVTAERTPDGSSFWAYVPTGRTITIDMSQLSGTTVQTWWYSPRTGNATAIGQFGNAGLQDFTTPTGEGESQDWILVADDASLNLPPPGMTNIQNWKSSCFTAADMQDPLIAGDMADPDSDGRNNLMEYALNSDPTVPDLVTNPVAVSIASPGNGMFLKLAYTRRKNAFDLDFGVTASNDLQAWSLLGETAILDNGFTESIEVQDSVSLSSAPKRFIRLEVTLDPQ
jgi:hypothetical protein